MTQMLSSTCWVWLGTILIFHVATLLTTPMPDTHRAFSVTVEPGAQEEREYAPSKTWPCLICPLRTLGAFPSSVRTMVLSLSAFWSQKET